MHRHELVDVALGEPSRPNEVDRSRSSLDVALTGGVDVPDPVDVGPSLVAS
jgi:hypothetical protein